jgi:hypothetical protein
LRANRPWRFLIEQSRRIAATAARNEARHLERRMEEVGAIRPDGYSAALLARAIAERQLFAGRKTKLHSLIMLVPVAVGGAVLTLPFWIAESEDDAEAITFLAGMIGYALMFVAAAAAAGMQDKSGEVARRRKFLPPDVSRIFSRSPVGVQLFMLVVGLAIAAYAIDYGRDMSRGELIKAALTSAGIIIWFAALMATAFGSRRILVRQILDAELIWTLAAAFGRIADASQSRWRKDPKERNAVVRQLGGAAALMEARHRAALAFVTPSLDAPSWTMAQDFALRLRGLAAKVELSGAERRNELAAWIGSALAAAVARRPDCIPTVGLGLAQTPSAPIRRGSRFWRWIVTALLPAAGILVFVMVGTSEGWAIVSQNQSLFIQLAVLAFVVGTTAALDPAGYDKRLGAIGEAGGALFGWGKKKG